MARKLRLGLIGMGNIGKQHIATIRDRLADRIEVTGLCAPELAPGGATNGAQHFLTMDDLFASKLCEAVLICTPTMAHKPCGEAALKAGLHVLMEKPIGLSVGEGEALLALPQPNQKFAVMLNQRFSPAYAEAKRLIASDVLGEITRYHWIMTNWFRPDIYFRASDWRGTWIGEGGGVLVNQCIHNLDILQWLVGLPDSVVAQCEFGKYHDIEVEDEVSALFRHANGATGVFISSTGEAPGRNELEIVGTKASLSFDGKLLRLSRNTPPTGEYSRTTGDMFGSPDTTEEVIPLTPEPNQHAQVLANFADAVLDGAPLATPAAEGLASLHLAGGMLLSQWTGSRVALPLDAAAYQHELDRYIAASHLREPVKLETEVDMGKSFR